MRKGCNAAGPGELKDKLGVVTAERKRTHWFWM